MQKRAKEGACLAELVAMAIPICQQAEQACPRTGPGREPDIPDWQMAVFIMVAIAKRKKSKSAQYRCLTEHRELLAKWLDTERFPSRSTYFDRYRRAHCLLAVAIQLHGDKAVRYGWTDAEVVAVDKSLVAARGPVWHCQKGRNRQPRPGVDQQAAWGRNECHGWVYGYAFEVVVSCGKKGVLWPLLASSYKVNRSEHLSFREKISDLPKPTRYVLADRGYDADDHCEAIEWTADSKRTGRRFLCPTMERCNARRPRRQAWKESHKRKTRRAHREDRRTVQLVV